MPNEINIGRTLSKDGRGLSKDHGKEDDLVFYPENDIYPYAYGHPIKWQTKEGQCQSPYKLYFAVVWLQEKRFMELLNDVNEAHEVDIFENGKLYNMIEWLCIFCMRYPFKFNKEKYIRMMKVLFEHAPKMSLTAVFHNAELNQNFDLIETIKENMPEVSVDVCYVCLCYEPSVTILRKVCSCKSIVHATCLTKLMGKDRICKVCRAYYKTNQRRIKLTDFGYKQEFDSVVFFPYEDIYYQLALRPTLFKAEGIGQVQFAIIFLQTKRLRELLCNKSRSDSELIYFDSGFRKVCELLKKSLPSNYSKTCNKNAYLQTKLIVNHWCIAHGFEILFNSKAN
jgi:hypothetical protein